MTCEYCKKEIKLGETYCKTKSGLPVHPLCHREEYLNSLKTYKKASK